MLSGNQRYRIIDALLPINKYGNHIRLVDEKDAEFIFMLRTDPVLSRFLSKTQGNVNDQKKWIFDYKKREARGEEFYFICIDSQTGERHGLNRIYNFNNDIFELGSWIYRPTLDISKSILGDIAVREIAFEILEFNSCFFEVRKGNKSVIKYHKGYSPELKSEDEYKYYFKLSRESFNIHKQKYLEICGYGKCR